MIKDQIIEKKKRELKRLKKFREHIPILKVNVGLSDEYIDEVLSKVDLKILNCEIIIREYNLKYYVIIKSNQVLAQINRRY